jgi:hypothetical protein
MTIWPPWVLPADWATGGSNDTAAGVPTPFASIFSRTPGGPPGGPFTPSAPAFPLDGFDVAFTQLLFANMLGLTPVYLPFGSFLEAYLALREGRCHVMSAALELERSYAACDAACPPVPPSGAFDLGDYDYATQWSPALKGRRAARGAAAEESAHARET